MPREPKGVRIIRREGQRGKAKRAYNRKYRNKRGCFAFFLIAFAFITETVRRMSR